MTDKRDSDRAVASDGTSSSDSEPLSKEQWESLDSDPDFGADFGYELCEWEQFETLDDTDQVIFLPDDESQLRDAAFVVAEESTLINLENQC